MQKRTASWPVSASIWAAALAKACCSSTDPDPRKLALGLWVEFCAEGQLFREPAACGNSRWKIGGERGIRTLGTLARSTVFETAPFDHSGTSPGVS